MTSSKQEQYQISKLSNVNEIIKNINKDEDKDETDLNLNSARLYNVIHN